MAAAMIDHLMRGSAGAYSSAAPWKLKLYTVNPDFDTGTGASGTQLTGTGYTAGGQSVTMTAANWNAAAGGTPYGQVSTNIAVPSWTATAADWSGAITGAAFLDSGGTNMMFGKALDNNRTVGNGDTFRFSAASIKLGLDQAAEAGISDFWKAEILDHFLATDRSYTGPASMWMALYTANPDFQHGTGGTEITGVGNYARLEIVSNTAWDAADGSGNVDNTAEIAFPACTGTGWGTITAACLFSASTSGTMFCGNSFTGQAIGLGDTFKIAAGAFDVSVV
jgi:hypothetical protein